MMNEDEVNAAETGMPVNLPDVVAPGAEGKMDQSNTTSEENKSSTRSGSDDMNLTCSEKWTRMIQSFMKPIHHVLIKVSHHAAMNPKAYIWTITILSFVLMGVGLATNFEMNAEGDVWTPQDTRSAKHGDWVESTEKSGFPEDPRYSLLILHRDGKNMLGDEGRIDLAYDGVRRMFEALDVMRQTPGYKELCAKRDYVHPVTNETTCDIYGIPSYWNSNTSFFDEFVAKNENNIDVAIQEAISDTHFPSGRAVEFDQIIGFNKCVNGNGNLVECEAGGLLFSGTAYVTAIGLPGGDGDAVEDEAMDFETDAIDNLKELQKAWRAEKGNDIKLEILATRSFDDEFMRAMSKDFPLVPLVFVLMSVLCIAVFARRDPVFSRAWLGFGAVVTVLMAIMSSFGLLFIIGVPFTNLTPILPFIMFGIGLDDAFIIAGAYTRTNHMKPTTDRLTETMQDIGGTILLTTLTASVAFALGLLSSIPAVRYLVLYGFPTILIDFVYQVTFFVALISIDERRIKDNRRDCCFCCRDEDEQSQSFRLERERHPGKHFADRAMIAYGNFLLKPKVKAVVLVVFAAMFAALAYSTSQLEQYFDFTEILPSDSYIHGWWDALQDYTEKNGVRAGIYFRDVDFSSPYIQEQMKNFTQRLVDMPYAGRYPFNFWLNDLELFVEYENITDLTFNEQIAAFLSNDVLNNIYKDHIVLDETGTMTASRTELNFEEHDYEDIKQTVDALELQEEISATQPVNQGRKDWAFFTFAEDYYIWEFYRVSPDELILSTILGTVSVSVLALFFIPHWSAVFIVFFMLCVLYIDLMGFIQLCGVSVGPVMYIGMVMSIGLMVDYVMHVTYRFIEIKADNREEKTKIALETIGASVLLGGLSTLIGAIPLGAAGSEIFFTVFVIFFGLVLLGLLHGLVLLPVLLSIIGPEVVVETGLSVRKDSDSQEPTETKPLE